MSNYQLANLCFSLDGAGPVYDYIASEFSCLPYASGNPILRFVIDNKLPPIPKGAVSVRSIKGWGKGFQNHIGGITYHVEADGNSTNIVVSPDKRALHRSAGLRASIARICNWNYLSPAEVVAKDFMYSVFNMFSACALARSGHAAYLHAASFERDTRGIALVASGGVGKTTSLLKLVTENEWNYLSDDIALVDTDGTLWRTPLRMQVYAYNTLGQPEIASRLLNNRRLVDRWSWHIKHWCSGPNGVRRRVKAEALFGEERIASKANLETLIFLERVQSEEFLEQELSVQDLIARVQFIMPSEIGPLASTVNALNLAGCTDVLPLLEEFQSRTTRIFMKAFSGVLPVLLRIPAQAGPNELAYHIRELIQHNHH